MKILESQLRYRAVEIDSRLHKEALHRVLLVVSAEVSSNIRNFVSVPSSDIVHIQTRLVVEMHGMFL
jgi:hypothetical protein